MDPENYGKIDMETVNVMTCGKELAGHKEMLGRSTGLEGEGNVNGEGVEDYELRQRLDRSGKDITGNPTAQDELIHGAKKVMKEKGGKLLESIQLFDVYEGSQIEEGYKSVAFSLVFRSPERSLEAAEINKIVDKILKELEKMGVELRA